MNHRKLCCLVISSFAIIVAIALVVSRIEQRQKSLYSESVQFGVGIDGLILGDSTIAAYDGGAAIADLLFDSQEYQRTGVVSIAYPGDTIAQQKTAWESCPFKKRLLAKWVFVQIGLNDMDPSVPVATTINAMQDLVNTIRADISTNCKLLIGTMTPAYERWETLKFDPNAAQAKWVAMNEAIMGHGGSPIIGVDGRTEEHTTSLTHIVDGNSALAPAYDSGDHIHPTNSGREIIAAAWRKLMEDMDLI